jgi:hypothetical protein
MEERSLATRDGVSQLMVGEISGNRRWGGVSDNAELWVAVVAAAH